jgi:hypothetical protein
MRTYIFLLLFLLGFVSCHKNPADKNFCKNCDMKTDGIQVIENKTGWIVLNTETSKYMIGVAHYNDPILYVPCQLPNYFHPVEMASVEFSGTVIEDPYIEANQIKTTYFCIKLDTIHLITPK